MNPDKTPPETKQPEGGKGKEIAKNNQAMKESQERIMKQHDLRSSSPLQASQYWQDVIKDLSTAAKGY